MKVKIMFWQVLIFILCVSSLGCDKFAREEFSFERQDYFGSKINLSGYYYRGIDEDRYVYNFFYNNGVILSSSLNNLATENELNDMLKSMDFSLLKELPYYWGVFLIDNNSILIEQWISGDGGSYPILKSEGEILNDTTFVIQWKMNTQDNKEEDVEELYKFMNFDMKPDSTNMWIN